MFSNKTRFKDSWAHGIHGSTVLSCLRCSDVSSHTCVNEKILDNTERAAQCCWLKFITLREREAVEPR